MIFYFSGTGNSLWVAKTLAKLQGEQMLSVANEMKKGKGQFLYSIKPDEKMGFVFPIYAWAPPKIVMQFIRKLRITNYNKQYTFAVCTCVDAAGYAMKVLRSGLGKQNITLNSDFSVLMPNNYIIQYDVDSKEVEAKKLAQARQTLGHINDTISQKAEGISDSNKGPIPFVRTQIINPLFNTFGLGAKSFYAKDNCISCHLCEQVCPTKNIQLHKGIPEWGNKCTKCLACIHRCPVQAIQYGKDTENRGRYYYPDINDMEICSPDR